ncbi:MAG: 16S rRNA (cytosine(1402)-N(4))-methyltransferase RsmH [Nitrospirae bacterium]|nr:MAG: 16S rRNA (cytosine(1402)-N(4))-methyltransferase RsmH [Nitrospirota bacterium]
MRYLHRPVMVEEVLGYLVHKIDGVYVDCTLGSGGHTEAILKRCPGCTVIGIDRDPDAIERARRRLPEDRVIFINDRFSNIKEALSGTPYKGVDGVLLDLGVSMEQLKDPERGFSFLSDEALDMRMDRSQSLTAEEIVNTWPERDIERILREYAEEKKARRIAKEIVNQRKKSPVKTCRELAEIVLRVYGSRRARIHPATKTFQALRIAVNNELEELQRALPSLVEVLNKKGRMVVIAYHSLEDRIVKNFMKEVEKEGLLRVLTKKVVLPSEKEKRLNPASRSARLRAAERC